MNIVPNLYDNSNQLQARDGEKLLKRIRDDIRDGQLDCLVDIGCGTGNITIRIKDYLNYERIVAFDKIPDMISFAENHYKDSRISYKVGDILEDGLKEKLNLPEEGADIVLSIYCLHWITSDMQAKAMANISSMLKPGGKCYLLFFSWSDILPLQENWARYGRWREFFKSVEQSEDEPQDKGSKNGPETDELRADRGAEVVEARRKRSSAPFETFGAPPESERLKTWTDLCTGIGLKDVDVTISKSAIDFETAERFRDHLKSLCHFLRYIPEDLADEFMEEYYEHVDKCYTARKKEQYPESKVLLSYEYFTVIATKPEESQEPLDIPKE
jgi:SAM-dependent methyltransferase